MHHTLDPLRHNPLRNPLDLTALTHMQHRPCPLESNAAPPSLPFRSKTSCISSVISLIQFDQPTTGVRSIGVSVNQCKISIVLRPPKWVFLT
ncbi:hypothetical protein Syun_025695 [Stephania yunnanensis]|uniref:Uncharacterized protein n=1 Tax=Stephania yunnanensis TaxID=152371 RepID=A0AAP0ES52_9MAGN